MAGRAAVQDLREKREELNRQILKEEEAFPGLQTLLCWCFARLS